MKKKNDISPLKEILRQLKSSTKRYMQEKFTSRLFDFNKKKIENIIFSERTCLTVNFYDYLILNEKAEYLKRLYTTIETHIKLAKIYDYWSTFYKLYPNNYTDLKICKYIFRNIKNKQSLLDMNHSHHSKNSDDQIDLDTDEIFNSSVLKELMIEKINHRNITSAEKRITIMKENDNNFRNTYNNINNEKHDNSFESVEKFVYFIETSEKICNEKYNNKKTIEIIENYFKSPKNNNNWITSNSDKKDQNIVSEMDTKISKNFNGKKDNFGSKKSIVRMRSSNIFLSNLNISSNKIEEKSRIENKSFKENFDKHDCKNKEKIVLENILLEVNKSNDLKKSAKENNRMTEEIKMLLNRLKNKKDNLSKERTSFLNSVDVDEHIRTNNSINLNLLLKARLNIENNNGVKISNKVNIAENSTTNHSSSYYNLKNPSKFHSFMSNSRIDLKNSHNHNCLIEKVSSLNNNSPCKLERKTQLKNFKMLNQVKKFYSAEKERIILKLDKYKTSNIIMKSSMNSISSIKVRKIDYVNASQIIRHEEDLQEKCLKRKSKVNQKKLKSVPIDSSSKKNKTKSRFIHDINAFTGTTISN